MCKSTHVSHTNMYIMDVFVSSYKPCPITVCDLEHSAPQWPNAGQVSFLPAPPAPSSSLLHVPLLQGGQHIYIKVQPLCACDHQHCLSFDQL